MPTTIHLPKRLLEAVDRRARSLGISRNRLIVSALEREVSATSTWSPGFFELLEDTGPGDDAAVDAVLDAIIAARRSKGPVSL